jgi:DNA-directed RNA polymerase omega subunit
MEEISVEDLKGKADSLYRIVIVAARRANQLNKSESHSLMGTQSRKPTIAALREIAEGKLGFTTSDSDEAHFIK